MKKYNVILLFIFATFFSMNSFAQKKNVRADQNSQGNNKSNKPVKTNINEVMEYNSRVYNACVPEWVKLTGQVTYSVKEMRSDSKYFILYRIDLKKVTGVGETTGAVYKGGGMIMNKVNANFDHNHTEGNDIYKVRYKSPESTLIFTQKAHFVSVGGDQKVSFNEYSDSCK